MNQSSSKGERTNGDDHWGLKEEGGGDGGCWGLGCCYVLTVASFMFSAG